VVLSAQASDESLDLRVMKIFVQESFQLAAGIRKEDLRDKLGRRSRALDIEEDDSDVWLVEQSEAGYFATGCAGMYLGPRQTGS